jgi:hypothetical protein
LHIRAEALIREKAILVSVIFVLSFWAARFLLPRSLLFGEREGVVCLATLIQRIAEKLKNDVKNTTHRKMCGVFC